MQWTLTRRGALPPSAEPEPFAPRDVPERPEYRPIAGADILTSSSLDISDAATSRRALAHRLYP